MFFLFLLILDFYSYLFFFFFFFFFFFNDTATTEIYTLSLHDALPIDRRRNHRLRLRPRRPHRLFCLSQSENKSLRRARARRHLDPRRWRQAPPSPRRTKIHARQSEFQLSHRFLPLVPQWPFHPRATSHHDGSG